MQCYILWITNAQMSLDATVISQGNELLVKLKDVDVNVELDVNSGQCRMSSAPGSLRSSATRAIPLKKEVNLPEGRVPTILSSILKKVSGVYAKMIENREIKLLRSRLRGMGWKLRFQKMEDHLYHLMLQPIGTDKVISSFTHQTSKHHRHDDRFLINIIIT